MNIVEDLQKLLNYLETDEGANSFGKWLNNEDDDSFQYDFMSWVEKRKNEQTRTRRVSG